MLIGFLIYYWFVCTTSMIWIIFAERRNHQSNKLKVWEISLAVLLIILFGFLWVPCHFMVAGILAADRDRR